MLVSAYASVTLSVEEVRLCFLHRHVGRLLHADNGCFRVSEVSEASEGTIIPTTSSAVAEEDFRNVTWEWYIRIEISLMLLVWNTDEQHRLFLQHLIIRIYWFYYLWHWHVTQGRCKLA